MKLAGWFENGCFRITFIDDSAEKVVSYLEKTCTNRFTSQYTLVANVASCWQPDRPVWTIEAVIGLTPKQSIYIDNGTGHAPGIPELIARNVQTRCLRVFKTDNYPEPHFGFELRDFRSDSDIYREVHVSYGSERYLRQFGEPMPFEELHRYQMRNLKDRLTSDMLDRYAMFNEFPVDVDLNRSGYIRQRQVNFGPPKAKDLDLSFFGDLLQKAKVFVRGRRVKNSNDQ